MSDVQTWSTTAASNNSASPNGFPEGMAPSGVNDSAREVMAAVAKYRSDTDGVNTSTGSANAYLLAASRTMTAYAQGDRFCFKANFSNTGAATLNVDSLGAKDIKRIDGTALQAGEIPSGAIVDLVYDGTNFQLVSAGQIDDIPVHNMLCPHERLTVDYASAATVTITAAAVVLADSDGRRLRFEGLSETLTISSTGANGRDVLDNSGNEQASIWYHLFAIGKADGTLDVFASQVGYPGDGTSIYTRLPSGYTYAGYIGAIYNDSSSDLSKLRQRGDLAAQDGTGPVLSGGAAATLTAISLTTEIPITARSVLVEFLAQQTTTTTSTRATVASGGSSTTTQGSFLIAEAIGASTSYMRARVSGELLLTTAQEIKYYAASGSTCSLNVTGWRY